MLCCSLAGGQLPFSRRFGSSQPTECCSSFWRRRGYSLSFPADTPFTPPAIGISTQQFCDKVLGEVLPLDDSGRGSFDTLPTFVVGDPAGKFETHAPLTYDTSGEVGHPLWSSIFCYILKHCEYLVEYATVYVMVDTRNLAAHSTSQHGLPHWPAAEAWWHIVVKWWDPPMRRLNSSFSLRLSIPDYIWCTLRGLVPLSWLRWWLLSQTLTSSYWTVIACQLRSSKLLTFWKKPSWLGSLLGLVSRCQRSIPCTQSKPSYVTPRWYTRSTEWMQRQ